MMHPKLTLKTLVVAIALMGSSPAWACCGDGAAAAAGAQAAGASVSAAISTATSTIVRWLERINSTIEDGFSQLYSEIGKQTARQKVFNEGQIAVQSQLYMEKARADAEYKFALSPRICYETAGGTAAGVAAGETKQNLADLNKNAAKRALFTPNTTAAVSKIYDTHADKYCSAQDAQLGRCTAADASMQNADVRADLMLNASSYNAAQLEAAQVFVTNLSNPIPSQNIPKGWEKTPEGKLFIAGQYVEQARNSVATNSLNQSIAMRTPVAGLGTAAMMNKADVSEMEIMESQVKGRFEAPGWYKMLVGFSLENLMRELNKMKALELWMNYKSFQQMERIETILATQLAMDVKRDSEARLIAARQAAASSGKQ